MYLRAHGDVSFLGLDAKERSNRKINESYLDSVWMVEFLDEGHSWAVGLICLVVHFIFYRTKNITYFSKEK